MAVVLHWPNSVRDFLDALGVLPAGPEAISTLEDVRQAMLEALEGPVKATTDWFVHKLRISHRVRTGKDTQALWYLRSDMMQFLSASMGETAAAHQLEQISGRFVGLLPPGLLPRRAFSRLR